MSYDIYALEITPGYYTHLFIVIHNTEAPMRGLKRIARDVILSEAEEQCAQYPQADIELCIDGVISKFVL